MSGLLLSAVLGSFVIVRWMKGAWSKNPQYLAAAIVGSVAGALIVHSFWPALEDDLIVSGLVGIAGPVIGIWAFAALLAVA